MSAKILPFTGITKLDLPPDTILERAMGKLESVLVIGWDEEGELRTFSSLADGAEVLWMLELTKKRLLEAGEGDAPDPSNPSPRAS